MEPIRVAATPPKPLMIYDGECNFCKFWIRRWQCTTGERVDYVASQDSSVASRFPELSRERFQRSVQFIETDGKVYEGAEAVFRSLTRTHVWHWLFWMYCHVPGFRPLTEAAYHFVAGHREGFSVLNRWVWGRVKG